jgi:phosphatidylglycerophosphatase A
MGALEAGARKAGRLAVLAVSTGLGLGFLPLAPGTFGGLLAFPIRLAVTGLSPTEYAVFTAVFCLLAMPLAHAAGRSLGEPDSRHTVIDEVAGTLVAFCGAPLDARWLLAAFLLFRAFDVVKVPPANWIDRRMHNGAGVVLDDVAAGLWAAVAVHLLRAAFARGSA